MDYAKRRRKLRDWLDANGVDALLISSEANLRYLFGFAGEGLGVVGRDALVSTDRRYELDAAALPGRVKVALAPDGHLTGAAEYLQSAQARRVAFEADSTLYSAFESLKSKLQDAELVPARKVVEELRTVKEPAEIDCIRRAAAIMDQALAAVLPTVEIGVTEREMALELERATRLAGADAMAFGTICAFGPSAAFPHAVPGQRKLTAGDMIKIDCGAKLDGYCSDITRTVPPLEPDERFVEVYSAVYDAQQAAVEAARPGITGRELDAVAREIIAERGYADQFSHSLGHGLGLEVHEGPRVSSRSEEVLRPGMVVTIEPGIYIEGWGGVRIEDSVAITRNGCERLTNAPKADPPRG